MVISPLRLSIPSPSSGVWHLWVLPIRAYALCIITGVIVAVGWSNRRWIARGGRPGAISDMAMWAVPAGLIGARVYHLITDPELYFVRGRDPWDAFAIWHGGLGIWGGVGGGILGAWYAARRYGWRLSDLAWVTAPALPVAQAIGRVGNWFNQELYGRPSTLPWALRIAPDHRPGSTPLATTYQPTFLYELIWDLGVSALVVWAQRRFRLSGWASFALYAAAYTAGRGWIEALRDDHANHILGLRVNDWVSILVFVAAVVAFAVLRHQPPPGSFAPAGAGTASKPGPPSGLPVGSGGAEGDDDPASTGRPDPTVRGPVTGRARPTDRIRSPAPLLRRRLPSGRGATEQPNAGHDGDAALTPRFWLMVVLTGMAAGVLADLMMAVLFHVEHAAYAYHAGSFLTAVSAVSPRRRIDALLIAGIIGGIGWYLLRRIVRGKAEIDDALWSGSGELSFRRSLGTSLLSEVVIGLGASLGRESAPKLMGGAAGSLLARMTHLSPAQQRLLVACGGGAGLAAVYDVPLGGALFTAEILVGSLALPTILPALLCSGVATVTGWLYLPDQATYTDIPAYHSSARIIVWALLAGPLIGLLASGYVRLLGWVSHHRIRGFPSLFAPLVAFGILGVVGIAYPQLFGNGKGMAHAAFVGSGTLGLLLAVALLKPLATALCLSSGATGGLFTPVLSTGAVLGAGLGILWSHAWPGSAVGAYAMIGATAMIGAAMQAPLAALVLVLELTHTGFDLMVPMLLATATSTGVSRYLDGYSIYSARLPANHPDRSSTPPTSTSAGDTA